MYRWSQNTSRDPVCDTLLDATDASSSANTAHVHAFQSRSEKARVPWSHAWHESEKRRQNCEISLRSIILSARKAQRLRSADTLIPFLHSDSLKLTWILESFEFCLQIVNLLKRPAFVYFLIAQILRISCHSLRWTMRWSGSSVLSTTT